jgi:type I restriction enzyme M protein
MLNKEKLENLTSEVWKGAIKLRGKFKAKDYPSVILPMIMIRRIECVLENNREIFKKQIIDKDSSFSEDAIDKLHKENAEEAYRKKAELQKKIKGYETNTLEFYNKSNWTLKGILADNPSQIERNFREFVKSFSENIEDIIEKFDFSATITKMEKANALESIIRLVAEEDLSPDRLSNLEMGYVYENLLQLFSQDDAKDTGEHFTPREIIQIMVDLMEIDFDPEKDKEAISIYDPACGTGGMLSTAKEHIANKAKTEKGVKNVEDLVLLNGQELLASNYALCKADMLLKGDISSSNITHGNSLIPHWETIKDDGDLHYGKQFDFMISNPPFGVDWSEYKTHVEALKDSRYSWGMPPINDGALLFLQTMIEKMKPQKEGGSKIAVLFNGSPLSNGDATQGESEIRRHILENDLLDTIVMLPSQMFYNTGIYTYIWLLSNKKEKRKKDHVLIINARDKHDKEPKSFGDKRNRISEIDRRWIHEKFEKWEQDDHCKLFHYSDFAFHKVEVVFWQEDEKGNQMWITEPFDIQLNNQNAKNRFDLYGDMTFHIAINSPYKQGESINIEVHYDGETAFETAVANELKAKVPQLKKDKVNDIKKWFKNQEKTANFHHRHYIVDNEYIPFDRNAADKQQYINEFLNSEIEYEIISWSEAAQLGYEILPNKYFYKYQEPESSDKLIEEFWKLEAEAEQLLNEIRAL